ncbi:putative beta-N-acetylhexosaminidase [Helianthus annuus]|uniref:Beta-N-acetylhexosaminidase n=1 Tax=Helianthus annuus TaxID=4232 RepID=A0A251USW1_HELAN|nr:putative beta-N-acetylhexosaminidase [Helianthus annuus]KAJ0488862.1 putative beta-N-acetylhexosaminidase [Helianthus annuus]KAJ0492455.1 putative beta-N-acetylhexosaminidase [Helianthus annuus]KAJ0504701.1 putative beta-N-acetylhexosaminidase [Helianthus annuus]KAJ0674434.1 putative beta-N-acetylhexosaminidase [Helianthus annuus]
MYCDNNSSYMYCDNNRLINYILGVLFQLIFVFGGRNNNYEKNVYIWPMPESVQYGNKTLILSKNFSLKTDGSKYKDESGILKDGFTRLLDVVTLNNVLQYGVDESYKLYINSKGNPNYAHIEAATVYGALHALPF